MWTNAAIRILTIVTLRENVRTSSDHFTALAQKAIVTLGPVIITVVGVHARHAIPDTVITEESAVFITVSLYASMCYGADILFIKLSPMTSDVKMEGLSRCFRCAGSYYGAQCEIDGEVLGVAVGSSLVAILIIITTLACLCAWR